MDTIIQSYLEEAQNLFNKNDMKNALSLYIKILQINPEHYLAHYNIGNIFLHLGKYDEAIKYYLHAIHFNPTYVDSYTNIGLSYSNTGDNLQAIKYLNKGLSIEPSNSSALNNLGNALRNIKKFKEAIASYEKAITFHATMKEAYNGLGASYEDTGQFDKAIKYYSKAIEIDKNYAEAVLNLYPLLIQYKPHQAIQYTLDDTNYYIYEIIYSFIHKPYHTSQSLITKLTNTQLFFSSYEKQKFGLNYLNFISTLLKYKPTSKDKDLPLIYHIGDSHSLSFAHHQIDYMKQKYTIKPLLIFGAKAFHLQDIQSNKFKYYFENYISNLKQNSYLLLSFGEIDCRVDEGIIPYHLKEGEEIKTIIYKTVNSYILYTSKILKKCNIKFIYMTIPAPISLKEHPHNLLRLEVVELFNKILKDKVKEMNLNITDTYSLTINNNKESNLKYMCDDYHLGPKILEDLKLNFKED